MRSCIGDGLLLMLTSSSADSLLPTRVWAPALGSSFADCCDPASAVHTFQDFHVNGLCLQSPCWSINLSVLPACCEDWLVRAGDALEQSDLTRAATSAGVSVVSIDMQESWQTKRGRLRRALDLFLQTGAVHGQDMHRVLEPPGGWEHATSPPYHKQEAWRGAALLSHCLAGLALFRTMPHPSCQHRLSRFFGGEAWPELISSSWPVFGWAYAAQLALSAQWRRATATPEPTRCDRWGRISDLIVTCSLRGFLSSATRSRPSKVRWRSTTALTLPILVADPLHDIHCYLGRATSLAAGLLIPGLVKDRGVGTWQQKLNLIQRHIRKWELRVVSDEELHEVALHTTWPIWLAMYRLQQRRPAGLLNSSFSVGDFPPHGKMGDPPVPGLVATLDVGHASYVHRRFGCGFGGENPLEMYQYATARGASWTCKKNHGLCFGRSPSFYAYAVDQFRAVSAALLSSGLRFFLCKSALLGYVRLCDLEPTDDDLSICMLATDLDIHATTDVPQAQQRLQDALGPVGWTLSFILDRAEEDCGEDLGGLPIGWVFGRPFEGSKWSLTQGLDLDVFLVYNLGGRAFCHYHKSVVRPQDLLPLRRTEFLGAQVYVPPDGGIALLEATYVDWTVRHIHAW